MADDRRHVDRLRQEQIIALEDTNQRINKLEGFAADYKALQDRLTTLPDKISHEIMVPFGKFAFMPGQIVHTNEVLVLLGDNWFCDQSAKQAVDIAGRRVKALEVQIQELEKQRGLLEPRLAFTSELDDALQEQQNIFEIKEDYNEEDETKWKAMHRERVRQHKQSLRSKVKPDSTDKPLVTSKPGDTDTRSGEAQSDAELWRRLDELELQERRNREMVRDTEDSLGPRKDRASTSGVLHKAGVRWRDQEEEEEEWEDVEDEDVDEDDDDDDDDSDYYHEEEDEDNEEVRNVIRPSSIKFSHTTTSTSKTQDGAVDPDPVEDEDEAGPPLLVSPADVYDSLIRPVLSKPRSILKPSKKTSPTSQKAGPVKKTSKPLHIVDSLPNQTDAFSGTVKEKRTTTSDLPMPKSLPSDTVSTSVTSAPPVTALQSSQDNQPKRVSRFKAQRMKQETS